MLVKPDIGEGSNERLTDVNDVEYVLSVCLVWLKIKQILDPDRRSKRTGRRK